MPTGIIAYTGASGVFLTPGSCQISGSALTSARAVGLPAATESDAGAEQSVCVGRVVLQCGVGLVDLQLLAHQVAQAHALGAARVVALRVHRLT